MKDALCFTLAALLVAGHLGLTLLAHAPYVHVEQHCTAASWRVEIHAGLGEHSALRARAEVATGKARLRAWLNGSAS